MYFKVTRFDCHLGLSIHGNPKALYGQDLAFRLSVKCKAPLQKRKKTRVVGFHFVFCALFLADFITTVAKVLRTLCALGVCLTSGRNSFCGSSSMLDANVIAYAIGFFFKKET